MNIDIKPATTSDWQVIQRLNNQVFENDKDHDPDLDMDWPFSEVGIKYYQQLADGSYGYCLIAWLDDQAVGYVALGQKNFGYRKNKYIEIENIGVDPQYRSQGVGQQLLKTTEKWALDQGAKKLYVQAYWHNNKAIKYYKNNGFNEIGIELEKEIETSTSHSLQK